MLTRNPKQNIGYWFCVSLSLTFILSFFSPLNAVENSSAVEQSDAVIDAADKTQNDQVASEETEESSEDSEAELSIDTSGFSDLEQSLDSTRGRLASLMTAEQRKEILLIQLHNEFNNTDQEDIKTLIEEQIKQLNAEIIQIRQDFNRTMTGGIDQAKLSAEVEDSYNWQTDLEEIMKPIFRSMKTITEKPREIERLRSKIGFLKRNIESSKSALLFIRQLDSGHLPDVFLERITKADLDWSTRLFSLEEELNIVQFQLETRLDESSNFFNNFGETLQEFAVGRGLTIILAIFAFWSIWFVFGQMRNGYHYVLEKRNVKVKPHSEAGLTSRVFYYAYQIFTALVAVTAILLVFYVKGDWIMLGISMLILFTLFFSIKNFFPKFVVETKLLLNIGPVREGERIIYHGIPWKVDKIGIYTELYNPLLSGGRIRIQLKELIDMNSRLNDECELWFPCREGDMLLMPEGRLVKVELQTPDFVKLNYTGGATTTVRTNDFLSMSYANLSEECFRVSSYFGVDYKLQKMATTKIQGIFRDEIKAYLESQNYGKYLKVLRVELHEAGSSALIYKIIADFHGIAARHHNIISRALQSGAIDVCNRNDWTIPFNQLTLHKAEIPEQEEE